VAASKVCCGPDTGAASWELPPGYGRQFYDLPRYTFILIVYRNYPYGAAAGFLTRISHRRGVVFTAFCVVYINRVRDYPIDRGYNNCDEI